MNFFVYLLYSKKLHKFYCGYTSNLHKRIVQHNSFQSAFPSQGVPWSLIWCTELDNITKAKVLEQKLKNLNQVKKLKFILRYKNGIIDQQLLSQLGNILRAYHLPCHF